jgi:hypothetical protein
MLFRSFNLVMVSPIKSMATSHDHITPIVNSNNRKTSIIEKNAQIGIRVDEIIHEE